MTSVETRAGTLPYDELRPLLEGAHVIYEGCRLVRRPGVSDDELRRTTQGELRERGFPDPLPPIVVYSSPEERLGAMLPQGDPDRVYEHLPLTIIVDNEPQSLIDAARILLEQGAVGKGVLEQVTVIQITPGTRSDMVDPETGILIIKLPPGQLRYPFRPTPAS
ncbi:MAG: hypothetical protein Q7S60_02120 [bacterium]|nr:hypothetical protein [bacterium]